MQTVFTITKEIIDQTHQEGELIIDLGLYGLMFRLTPGDGNSVRVKQYYDFMSAANQITRELGTEGQDTVETLNYFYEKYGPPPNLRSFGGNDVRIQSND